MFQGTPKWLLVSLEHHQNQETPDLHGLFFAVTASSVLREESQAVFLDDGVAPMLLLGTFWLKETLAWWLPAVRLLSFLPFVCLVLASEFRPRKVIFTFGAGSENGQP